MVRTGSMLLAVVVLILSLSLVAMADNDTLVIGSGQRRSVWIPGSKLTCRLSRESM